MQTKELAIEGNQIRRTEVGLDGCVFVVSTISLDIDHPDAELLNILSSFLGRATTGYESMVFAGDGQGGIMNFADLHARKYDTLTLALAGHDDIIQQLGAGRLKFEKYGAYRGDTGDGTKTGAPQSHSE